MVIILAGAFKQLIRTEFASMTVVPFFLVCLETAET